MHIANGESIVQLVLTDCLRAHRRLTLRIQLHECAAVDNQFRLYVVDSGRYRIQIYRKTFRELAPDQVDGAETYNDPKLN